VIKPPHTSWRSVFTCSVFVILSTLIITGCVSQYQQLPSANYGKRVKSIVIHYTAIDFAQSVTALVDEGGLSSHYLVPESNDPSYQSDKLSVLQLVDESDRAWHAGKSYWQGREGLNDSSIGIEIVNVPQCQYHADDTINNRYGSNRECDYPRFDPQQITLVIALLQDILTRHPDIHPTAIIGHADIAPQRKSDPGPRFPWQQLYDAGIGAWFDASVQQAYVDTFSQQSPDILWLQQALNTYGYQVRLTGQLDSYTSNVITAFQMHFLPQHVTAQPDVLTAATVMALLNRYFPERAETLLAQYQTNLPDNSELAYQSGSGQSAHQEQTGNTLQKIHTQWQAQQQVAEIFPTEQRSKREWVNDREQFYGLEAQGTIRITTQDATHARIQINGQTLNIAQPFRADYVYQYDLHKRTTTGLNTLHVSDVQPEGAQVLIGIDYPTITASRAQGYQFNAVDTLINEEIKQGFPGAVLLALHEGKIIKHSAYGYAQRYSGSISDDGKVSNSKTEPMRTDTLFDLASNTKTFATTLALMHLHDRGQIDINLPVNFYLPEFIGNGREFRTIRDLLSHQSGFASQIQFYQPDNALGKAYFSQDKMRTSELLTTAVPFSLPLQRQHQYSDINFMILGLLIERVTGQPLDKYTENTLYAPLGLTHTLFNPLHKDFAANQFAATEIQGNTRGGRIDFPNIRTKVIRGEVHDENAFYSMAGVSGHAGLFSRAEDLAVLAQLLINGGGYGQQQLFSELTLETFIQPTKLNSHFALGWRRAGRGANNWHFGPYASARAFGHTGWTGTATVIDPEHDLAIILLTNMRHSPIVGDDEAFDFAAKTFETGKYGSIISLIYESILHR
jgi:N-acetyl-anhydromuramyl-L-alanine amidase AmpD/CubicO group peptidase (beta-lactamase class C family)